MIKSGRGHDQDIYQLCVVFMMSYYLRDIITILQVNNK